jgi:hypothetical protein
VERRAWPASTQATVICNGRSRSPLSASKLKRTLYSGISHPTAVQLARDVGVGPFRELAAAALKEGKADDSVCDFLSASLKKTLERRRQLAG